MPVGETQNIRFQTRFLEKFTCSCQLYFQFPSDLRLTVLVFSISRPE